ncbi:MAG: biopolymer transporter ExbD [Planctomycetes bacterium]|nr:biopolymer transporter ExbD [Planctomycetota bacterium]
MNLRDDEGLDEPALNLTPLIDVVFQLLVFFMVATTFQDPERALDVELPPAESGARAEREPEELVIQVLRDGTLRLGGEALDRAALAERLRSAAEHDPATPVTIRGDRLVHHEDVVAVMDACGLAGLHALSLGTLDAAPSTRR